MAHISARPELNTYLPTRKNYLQDTPLFFCVTSLKIAGQVSTHAQIMSDQLRAHNVALSLLMTGTITILGVDQRNNAACFKGSSLPESSR